MNDSLLQVRDLTVAYQRVGARTTAVHGVSFDVGHGESVALVGESGSGKTSIGRAILGLHGRKTRLTGAISFDGTDLLALGSASWRQVRGKRIALIPQDPLAGLNPVHTVGRQVAETLRTHGLASGHTARTLALEALRRAGLDEAEQRYDAYPHQLSGGQRQRVLIATALIGEPELIVADEPTSALDVTVQRRILDHIESLVGDSGTSMLLITHDLAVAADRTDRVVVLSGGEVVEEAPSATFRHVAQHPYSRRLVAAAPSMNSEPMVGEIVRPVAGPGAAKATTPLVEIDGVTKTFSRPSAADVAAVDGVSLQVHHGQSLGVVGESGSGKTTLARMVLGLTEPTSGLLRVAGQELHVGASARGRRRLYRQVQPVFQDPYSSLDPAHPISTSIAEPLRFLGACSRAERRRQVADLLDQVRLPRALAGRKPYELSGGQMQRVAIARALAIRPGLLVLDEPVSSLDVSVQDQILRLLAELREQSGLAYLFISHDLAVVRQICTDVAVMRHGKVVERGPTVEVFASPEHGYTRELLHAIPGRRAATGAAVVP